MTFLNQLVSLVATMEPIWTNYLFYVLALAFLATVPYIFQRIIGGGKGV